MRKFLVPTLYGLTCFISLSYFILVRRNLDLDAMLLLRYAFVGILVAGYAAFLQHYNLNIGLKILGVAVVLSLVALWSAMGKTAEPFADLGAIFMWIIAMYGGVILSAVVEMILFILRKYKR